MRGYLPLGKIYVRSQLWIDARRFCIDRRLETTIKSGCFSGLGIGDLDVHGYPLCLWGVVKTRSVRLRALAIPGASS